MKNNCATPGNILWRKILLSSLLTLGSLNVYAEKSVEQLDRGLVVIPATQGNAISWRLLINDSTQAGFNVYRN